MKKQIRMTEADLHNVIRESVNRILMENEEEEGLWQSMKNAGRGLKSGWNTYRASELANNDSYQPKNFELKDVANHMQQLDAEENKLQVQLNQIRNEKFKLAKQYGLSRNPKGYQGGWGYKNGVPGAGGGVNFRQSAMQKNGGLNGQANMNKG